MEKINLHPLQLTCPLLCLLQCQFLMMCILWGFFYNINLKHKVFCIFKNLFIFIGGLLRYNIVVVLPYIDMNQCMCSPSWSPLPPPSPSHPSGSSQCTSPEHLSHASNLGWWSVSHMIIYIFQCYSLRSSHPRFLPQSPKHCSIHLCLYNTNLKYT